MKSKKLILFMSSLLLAAVIAFVYNRAEPVKESMIYFPADDSVHFKSAQTSIELGDKKDNDEYVVAWKVSSETDKEVYLRQDVSLLYADGRLVETMTKWEENVAKLSQTKEIAGEDSSHYKTISFHHGEVHYDNNIIKSVQKMSTDHLYVIDSPKQILQSFKHADSKFEKDWKAVLDHATKQQLKYSWGKLINKYQIPVDKYKMIPLTSLYLYDKHPLPGLSMQATDKAIGRLWEGLYKNYILGLKNHDGTTLSPIGSSIPIILYNKDHMIVLIRAANGESFQLIQYMTP